MSEYIVKIGFWLRAYDGFAVETDSDARAIEKAKAAANTSMESADHPEHIEIGERRKGTIALIDRITTGGRGHPAIGFPSSMTTAFVMPHPTDPSGHRCPQNPAVPSRTLGRPKHVLPSGTVGLRRAIYSLDISPFLTTIVLCLSIRIRGYDDPNFHIPSIALTLHLWSCEIVSASFAGLGSLTARCGKAFF